TLKSPSYTKSVSWQHYRHLRSVFSHKLQRMLNDPHVDTRR
ncbi:transposase, partial [Escherichia coli]